MKRVCTLIGGIFSGLYDVICIIYLFMSIPNIKYYNYESSTIIYVYIDIVIVAITLLFNILSITAFYCSHEKYRRKKGIIITAIVFNLIATGLNFNPTSIVLLLLIIVSFITIILYSIDLGLERKRCVTKSEAYNYGIDVLDINDL